MTQEEIIEMARQTGLLDQLSSLGVWFPDELVAFAKLVAAKEREACAKLCEELEAKDESFYCEFSRSSDCATAIRARGEQA